VAGYSAFGAESTTRGAAVAPASHSFWVIIMRTQDQEDDGSPLLTLPENWESCKISQNRSKGFQKGNHMADLRKTKKGWKWKQKRQTQTVEVGGCDASPTCQTCTVAPEDCTEQDPPEDVELQIAQKVKAIRERFSHDRPVVFVGISAAERAKVLLVHTTVVPSKRSVDAYPADANYITCRFCGTRQSKYNRDCWKCHEPLGQ
jgi:hypothetical protein